MADSSQAPHSTDEAPIGTLVILTVYLIVLVGIWGTVYFIMLQRG